MLLYIAEPSKIYFQLERIVKKLKQNTNLKIILFENIQLLNSFSLRKTRLLV